jgi:hypothetical protein
MSKGSKQRPLRVSEEEFADNWRRTFGLETHATKKAEEEKNDG